MSKLIIFDFDGVLFDSFDQTYEINRLAAELVGKVLSMQAYKDILNGSFHVNFSKFLDLDELKLKKVLDFKYKIFNEYYVKSKLFGFCSDMLLKLYEKDVQMAIVSAANENSIKNVLKIHDIFDKFFFIAGMNKTGKVENIDKCIQKSKASKSETFFITDTVGDIKDAKKADVRVVAVTWGFHGVDDLRKENPDFIIDDPSKIFGILR